MERKTLTQAEVLKELNEIENDSELTPEEKELFTKIYSAELERQRKDERIDLLKKQMEALKMKIAEDISKIMPTFDAGNEILDVSKCVCLDDDIIGKKENLWELEKKLVKAIKSKYENMADELEGIIDPDMFELDSKVTEGKKSRQEIDEIYIREFKKINGMDIYTKEKGILKNIVNDAMKYIGSKGIIELDGFGERVEEVTKSTSGR